MPTTLAVAKVRSYWLDRFGIENLTIKETEQTPLISGQVRVKINAVSLNYRDLLIVKGLYDPKVISSGGIIPLSDAAGEIVEVASDVNKFKIGDKVAPIFLQKWLAGNYTHDMTNSALGGSIDGVLSNYKVFHQDGLVILPKNYSFEEGATLPCAAITAWHALVIAGKIKAGETVLIQGTGGVSIFALQFAKMCGAIAIVTSASDEKLEKAKKLGADYLINYDKIPEWETKAREYTNHLGVDHIVEVGGAKTLAKSFKAVKTGGRVSVIGILSGTDSGISLLPILMKNLSVQGIYVGSKTMFESMNNAIAANNLKPVIDKVFSFADSKQALQYLEKGQHFGKVVIKID